MSISRLSPRQRMEAPVLATQLWYVLFFCFVFLFLFSFISFLRRHHHPETLHLRGWKLFAYQCSVP